jgi:ribosomal protein S18 acetylase RimI-like enzyme
VRSLGRYPGDYSAIEPLRDGRRVEIRALQPNDRSKFLAAVERASAESLYRRFFSTKRDFTPQEVASFVEVDFVNQVALVAVVSESGREAIVGAGRYITAQEERAEMAFAVIDEYQRQGIGTALMHHLLAIAREAGIQKVFAEVLPENLPMLKVFERSGYSITRKRGPGAVHVAIFLG